MSASMMTTAEVAEYLGTTERAIYNRVHRNEIPFKKLGRARTSPLRFRKTDIDEWMSAGDTSHAMRETR